MASTIQTEPNTYIQGSGLTPNSKSLPTASLGGRIWRVYADAMDESGSLMKGIFKLVGVTSFWIKYFNPNAPKACSEIGTLTKNAKNITSVIEWPIRIEKLKKSISAFDVNTPIKSVADIGSEICSVINNGSDTAEFIHAVQPLPAQVMEKVKVANFTATFFGALKGAVDSIRKLSSNIADLSACSDQSFASTISPQAIADKKSKTYAKVTSNMMSLVAKVCYVALGGLGLLSLAVPVAPVVMVSLLTVGTVLGLGNLFFDRIVDPNDDRAKKLASNPLFNSALNFRKQC